MKINLKNKIKEQKSATVEAIKSLLREPLRFFLFVKE